MINLDLSTLNPLEKKIHKQMIRHSKAIPFIRINQAAEFCQCSVSKISKFVKKWDSAATGNTWIFCMERIFPLPQVQMS